MSTVSVSSKVSTRNVFAIVAAVFNFAVSKLPLSGPDNLRTKMFGLFRDDSGECIRDCSVSAQYTPHTTDDVLALCEAAETAFGGVADVSCHFRKGHYVSLSPTEERRRAIYGTKDNIFPRILIRGSYDNKAFSASLGYFRDLCVNMHIIDLIRGTCVSFAHVANLRSKMDELVANFRKLNESWPVLCAAIEKLQNTPVSINELLRHVYGEAPTEQGRTLTNYQNRERTIRQRINRERYLSDRNGRDLPGQTVEIVSAWEALNGIQGYAQHDVRRRDKNSFSRNITAMNDPQVKTAERFLMNLAGIECGK